MEVLLSDRLPVLDFRRVFCFHQRGSGGGTGGGAPEGEPVARRPFQRVRTPCRDTPHVPLWVSGLKYLLRRSLHLTPSLQLSGSHLFVCIRVHDHVGLPFLPFSFVHSLGAAPSRLEVLEPAPPSSLPPGWGAGE